jgi:hypothetical protein
MAAPVSTAAIRKAPAVKAVEFLVAAGEDEPQAFMPRVEYAVLTPESSKIYMLAAGGGTDETDD